MVFSVDLVGISRLGVGNRGAMVGFSGDGIGVPGRGVDTRGESCRGMTRAGRLNDGG